MNKLIFIIIVIAFFSQTAFCQVDLSLDKKFVLGGNNFDTPEYIFRGPSKLVQDSKERIYIVDKGGTEIIVFDSLGIFLKTIGSNGKGPGEFLNFGSLDIINDTLIAFDGFNQRFTKLTYDGFLKTFQVDVDGFGYSSVKKVIPYSDNFLILLRSQKFRKTQSQSLLYIFDRNFSFKGDSFGKITSLWDTNTDFMRYQAYLRKSLSTNLNDGKLYLTPEVYENYILKIDIHNDSLKRVYTDNKSKYESYVEHSIDDFDKKIPNKLLLNGVYGRFVIQAVNRSLGIFSNGGYVYHFFIEKISENNSSLSLNVFSTEEGFLEKVEVKKYDGHPVNSLKILDFKYGNLFLTDLANNPVIEVYKLNIEAGSDNHTKW